MFRGRVERLSNLSGKNWREKTLFIKILQSMSVVKTIDIPLDCFFNYCNPIGLLFPKGKTSPRTMSNFNNKKTNEIKRKFLLSFLMKTFASYDVCSKQIIERYVVPEITGMTVIFGLGVVLVLLLVIGIFASSREL